MTLLASFVAVWLLGIAAGMVVAGLCPRQERGE